MNRLLSLFFISFAASSSLFAQAPLTRAEVVQEALTHSYTIKHQRHEATLTALDIERAKQTYIPKIGIDAAYFRVLTPVKIQRDISAINAQAREKAVHSDLGGQFEAFLQSEAQMQAAQGNTSLAQAIQNPQTQALLGATQKYVGQLGQGALGQLPDRIELQLHDQNLWFVDAHADMVIFSGGQVPTLRRAAESKLQAQEALIEKSKQQIISETLQYYDKLAVVAQSERVLNESQRLLDQKRKQLEKAIDNGLRISSDINKINLAEKRIQAKRIELNGGRALLLAKLQQLTGLDPQTLQRVDTVLSPWNVSQADLLLHQRAEIQAIDHSIQALKHKSQAARNKILPQAKAFVHLTQGGSSLSFIKPALLAGVGMKWEVFDGLQRKNEIEKAQLEVEAMEMKRHEAEELIALEYQKYRIEQQVKTELLDVAAEKHKEAKEELLRQNKMQQHGVATLGEVLEAQAAVEKAALEEIQYIYAQRQASAALLKAMGELSAHTLSSK